ncbi:hypothetical protein RN001_006223 [Aquatica leii]|uniref:Peptidase S1 domain-containing protein n=1 Tax=Aquatica leii TaxID=1421715 RepID=A0AAN7Q1I7_9COLE|nr:hypothetical protein RN001_006223 [Aquatica leii]
MPYFDIALITLKEDAKDFMPICLPDKVIRNNEGIVQGFGKLHANNETVPCTLQEAHLLVYSESKCKNMLEYHGQNSSELQHAFCAGYLNGKVDTCMGDSGGPFVVVDKTGRYIQQGITSFGFGCAKRNALGIYTDVSHFVDWIYDKIDTEEQNIFIPSNNATLITPVNSAHQLHFESEHKISIKTNSQKFFWPFRFRRPKKKIWITFKANSESNFSKHPKTKNNIT